MYKYIKIKNMSQGVSDNARKNRLPCEKGQKILNLYRSSMLPESITFSHPISLMTVQEERISPSVLNIYNISIL